MESRYLFNSNKGGYFPTVRPNCSMIWLAPGLIEGDTYECRSCGVSFVVGRSPVRPLEEPVKGIQPENDSHRRELFLPPIGSGESRALLFMVWCLMFNRSGEVLTFVNSA